MPKRVLITGGCGFLGHHIVDHVISNTNWEIVIIDKLSYASNGFDRLRDSNLFNESRIDILTHDLSQPIVDGVASEIGNVDYVIHAAGETHVDRSLLDPRPFVLSNVLGTMELLEWARKNPCMEKIIYVSTDEVFGPSPTREFSGFEEWDRYHSSTPYAASKAGGEELCIAYHNAFKLPISIIHTMNLFGERQFPEKFIPTMIKKIIKEEPVKLHTGPNGEFSTRCWIHCRNVADAILLLLAEGEDGEKYNVCGDQRSNFQLFSIASAILGKLHTYESVPGSMARAGHDAHYALNGSRMAKMGWKAPVDFTNSFSRTVKWFNDNQKWLK